MQTPSISITVAAVSASAVLLRNIAHALDASGVAGDATATPGPALASTGEAPKASKAAPAAKAARKAKPVIQEPAPSDDDFDDLENDDLSAVAVADEDDDLSDLDGDDLSDLEDDDLEMEAPKKLRGRPKKESAPVEKKLTIEGDVLPLVAKLVATTEGKNVVKAVCTKFGTKSVKELPVDKLPQIIKHLTSKLK